MDLRIDNRTELESVLTETDLLRQLGISRTTLWRLRKKGEFPEPISLSANRHGYLRSEIEHWIALKAGNRRGIGR